MIERNPIDDLLGILRLGYGNAVVSDAVVDIRKTANNMLRVLYSRENEIGYLSKPSA